MQTRGISPLLLAAIGPMTEAQLEVFVRTVKMARCSTVLNHIQCTFDWPFPCFPQAQQEYLEVPVDLACHACHVDGAGVDGRRASKCHHA